jgi:hypothetical protein
VTGCDERAIVSMRGRQSRLFSNPRKYYMVSFCYEAGGRVYNSDFTAYRPYEVGARFAILFNPTDPQFNNKYDPQGDQRNTLVITFICLAAVLVFFCSAPFTDKRSVVHAPRL